MKVNKGRISKIWKCKEKLKKIFFNFLFIDCDFFMGFDLVMVVEGVEVFLKMYV